jgi:hypothetical protein
LKDAAGRLGFCGLEFDRATRARVPGPHLCAADSVRCGHPQLAAIRALLEVRLFGRARPCMWDRVDDAATDGHNLKSGNLVAAFGGHAEKNSRSPTSAVQYFLPRVQPLGVNSGAAFQSRSISWLTASASGASTSIELAPKATAHTAFASSACSKSDVSGGSCTIIFRCDMLSSVGEVPACRGIQTPRRSKNRLGGEPDRSHTPYAGRRDSGQGLRRCRP